MTRVRNLLCYICLLQTFLPGGSGGGPGAMALTWATAGPRAAVQHVCAYHVASCAERLGGTGVQSTEYGVRSTEYGVRSTHLRPRASGLPTKQTLEHRRREWVGWVGVRGSRRDCMQHPRPHHTQSRQAILICRVSTCTLVLGPRNPSDARQNALITVSYMRSI